MCILTVKPILRTHPWPSEIFWGSFNNIMSVLGTAKDEMLAVHLVKTYCFPVLLYGSKTWSPSLSFSDKYTLNVAYSNWFRRIFNGTWRESAKPLLFYCKIMSLMSTADQRRLTFLRNITCSANPVLSMRARLRDYEFRVYSTGSCLYNINCVHVSNSYIKSAVWSSSAECS